MLTNDLTTMYNDALDVAKVRTFKLVKYLPDGAYRLTSDSSLSEPHAITVRHSTSGSNGALTDRHLIQNTWTKLNSAGKALTGIVNVTFTMPRDPVFTVELLQEMFEEIASVLVSSAMLNASYQSGVTANPAALSEILRGGS